MKILGIISWVIGLLVTLSVAAGYYYETPILTTWKADWPSQKAPTCLAFIFQFVACAAFFLGTGIRRDSAIIGMSLLTMSIMCAALLSEFPPAFGEDLVVYANRPGEPSLGTFFTFTLLSVVSIVNISHVKNKLPVCWSILGGILGVMTMVLIGYIGNIPILMFYIPGYSAAISMPTLVGFVCLTCAWLLFIPKHSGTTSLASYLRPGIVLGASSAIFVISLLSNLRIVNHQYVQTEYKILIAADHLKKNPGRDNFLRTLQVQGDFIEKASHGDVNANEYIDAVLEYLKKSSEELLQEKKIEK